jgi:hypothetical protein
MNARIAIVIGASVILSGGALALVARRQVGKPAHERAARLDPVKQALAAAQPPAPPGKARVAPRLYNPTAYIPPQCYAVTDDGAGGRKHNGCFACHQEPREPNYTDDAAVQTELSFASAATTNRWTNAQAVSTPAAITDAELFAYVRTSNYFDERGEPIVATRLKRPPPSWDADQDGAFGGFIPDCYFHFDARGFDRAPDGRATGWRAFAYAPFPGMFWPTNGSAGDVMIRLPAAYRQDAAGHDDETIYAVNLAIVESIIRRADVPIAATDERPLGVDLDGDGALGTARRVAFVWPLRPGRAFSYVGRAATLDRAVEGWPAAGLYPRGTEFLHSVRYLDVQGGRVRMAARMKELRYMRKLRYQNYGEIQDVASHEAREKERHPDMVRRVFADPERGVGTGSGWVMQAFIEDADGALRPQTVEETTACIGCHGGIGATTDSTFSFARKLATTAFDGGWYHWADRGLAGIPEPKRADGQGEYAHWLAQVGGGDDYRSNDEVRARFFRPDGTLRPDRARALGHDIGTLLVPSPARALALDRAYLELVRAQSFTRGRDVLVGAAPKVHQRRAQGEATGITQAIKPGWAIAVARQ